MLKRLINDARIDLEIIPIDPLLIKSGQATVGGLDMSFVRTYRHDGKDEPFIPGSSLKGMLRSYAEKICRSLRDHPVPVCLPYADPGKKENPDEKGQASCGLRFEKHKKDNNLQTIPSDRLYDLSCPICRLFGSHVFIGRFSTADAYLTDGFRESSMPAFETRNGVAIDRFTGGTAGGALYDMEVLTRGDFQTSIEIRNFERWQLGLIGLILRDMEEGLIRIGSLKSRGLGRIRAEVKRFESSYFNRKVETLQGMWSLCSKDEVKQYGFSKEIEEPAAKLPPRKELNNLSLRHRHNITESWKSVLEPGVKDLVQYVETVEWPRGMDDFMRRGA